MIASSYREYYESVLVGSRFANWHMASVTVTLSVYWLSGMAVLAVPSEGLAQADSTVQEFCKEKAKALKARNR